MKKQTFIGLYLTAALATGLAACGQTNTTATGNVPGPVPAPMPVPGPFPVGPAVIPMPMPVPMPIAPVGCVGPSFDAGVYWYGSSASNQYITYRYVFTAPQTNVAAGRVIRVTRSGFQSNYPTQNFSYSPLANYGYYSPWTAAYGNLPTAWAPNQVNSEQISIRVSPTATPGAADLPTVLVLNQANNGIGQAAFPISGFLVVDYSVPALTGTQIFYGLNFMLCQ